jgi:hypothetical protein
MTRCCDDTPALLQPPPRTPPVEWCAGNFTYRFKDGKVTPIPRTPAIVDGVYTNPVIKMIGGCIESIQNGDSVIYSACDPCAPTPVPPPPTPLEIDGAACNLASVGPDGLLVQLYTAFTSCIQINGCGTPGSPLTAAPIISSDPGNSLECRPNGLFVPDPSATVGVNSVSCGIVIQNGLVTQLPLPFNPVLAVTSIDGSVVVVRNACSIDLAVNTLSGAGLVLQILNYDTVGDLPTTNAAVPIATVGTVNPRRVFFFVSGFGWREVFDSVPASLQVNL